MKNKPILYSLLAVMVVGFFLSFKLYNNYREKSFVDEINYNSSSFQSFSFSNKKSSAWKKDTKEPAEILMKHLSKYQIKKDPKCSTNLSKGFEFTIGLKDKTEKFVSVFDKCTYIMDSGLYKIVNGPVDMNWIQKFNKAYEQ